MERAIHVGHEQLYILLKRCRWDRAPINILVTHGRISATTVSKRGPHLEVRNNNVCLLNSRIAGTDTVNLDLSQSAIWTFGRWLPRRRRARHCVRMHWRSLTSTRVRALQEIAKERTSGAARVAVAWVLTTGREIDADHQ